MTNQEQIQNAQEQIESLKQEAITEREKLAKKSAYSVRETARFHSNSNKLPLMKEDQITLIIDRKFFIEVRSLERWIEKLQAR